MSLYDDFEDDDNVLMPRRAHTDIVRQDSSVELRNRFRSFWQAGEHLWAEDYNNNLQMLSWWSWPTLWHWRLPRAPWTNNPAGDFLVPRSGTYANLHAETNPFGPGTYRVPFAGAKLYSQADRLFIAFTGSAWKPMLYHYHYRPEIEVSMFASYPRGGEVCARYVATTKFQITNEGDNGLSPFSRFRANRETTIQFYKNGVQCGSATYSTAGTTTGQVTLPEPVTFDVGDELSIRAPLPLMGVTWLSISFMGRVIEE